MGITRAFVFHLAAKETVGAHLLTLHNVHYQLQLMRDARRAIVEDEFAEFVKKFFYDLYDGNREKYPSWAIEALKGVNIEI
jgi:tRNA-guanine family transglycosylase